MKKNNLENNTIRKIVGLILSSDISSIEIHMLSSELINSRDLSIELGNALKKSIQALENSSDTKPKNLKIDNNNYEISSITNLMEKIQDRKISKKVVISALPKNTFSNISQNSLLKMSLRDLLNRAFENSSENTINSFIRKIGIDSEPDPYLAGIDKNRY
ncbi:hypothetical protein O0881_21100 [Janthinobacterium sp. SUN100]|uniref:hypothetical protein n=1 Tax=Janthinobacterium sp. SUN100 TaxID=3004101 RepID=UPI0025B1AECD|nr:hypothetical protein [Janthinobacterium sp. SUN100]MDN2704482.1 hypothetical protein [Janthinobacterium sp. SUN100]